MYFSYYVFFAVLRQFCAEVITFSAFDQTQNAPVDLWRRDWTNFIREHQPS